MAPLCLYSLLVQLELYWVEYNLYVPYGCPTTTRQMAIMQRITWLRYQVRIGVAIANAAVNCLKFSHLIAWLTQLASDQAYASYVSNQ